jgi:hypothetical protein
MAFWLPQTKRRAWNNPDPRVALLSRFRNFAIFWIAILILYFVSLWVFVEETKTSVLVAIPIFVLLCGCTLIGAIWHAGVIIVMSLRGMLDRPDSYPDRT